MREALYRPAQYLQRDCGGRVMRRDNLHLTLVFLGNIARDRMPLLESIAGLQQRAGFDLQFGVINYWRHNRIVWAGPHSMPEPLDELVAALEDALRQAQFAFDPRPYVPHMTLIRDARAPAMLPSLEFIWPVRDFALVESAPGAHGHEYRALAQWPLQR